jgi:hypothetical protein
LALGGGAGTVVGLPIEPFGGAIVTKPLLGELLQEKAEKYEAETRKNQEMIDEWIGAVRKLFKELRRWLSRSDPSKILRVDDGETEVSEPSVGQYKAPRLEIRAFGKWVGVIPKARKTIKTARPPRSNVPERATGRVDITDEIRRYVLYRFTNNGKDSWVIEGPNIDDCQPLTQELFEEALKSYFE